MTSLGHILILAGLLGSLVGGFLHSPFLLTIAASAAGMVLAHFLNRAGQMLRQLKESLGMFLKVILYVFIGWSLCAGVIYFIGFGLSKLFGGVAAGRI